MAGPREILEKPSDRRSSNSSEDDWRKLGGVRLPTTPLAIRQIPTGQRAHQPHSRRECPKSRRSDRPTQFRAFSSCVRSETPTRVSELSQGAAVKLPAARNCILLKSAGTSTAGRNGSSKTVRLLPHPINLALTVSCNSFPCKGFLVPRGVH